MATTAASPPGRVEIKYLVSRTTRTGLVRDLSAFLTPDTHADAQGFYGVRSLYLESPDYSAYHDKLAGLGVRHKLRARTYGADLEQASTVRLEIKSRYLQQIVKKVVDLPREQYAVVEAAMLRRILPPEEILSAFPGTREFFYRLKRHGMEPKILLQYRRQALERWDGGRIRVSIDDDLIATRNLELLGPLHGARRILEYGNAIVEFKLEGAMPFWLHTMIAKYELVDRAMSKFCSSVRSEARLSAAARGDD
jgi:hypothetical protein